LSARYGYRKQAYLGNRWWLCQPCRVCSKSSFRYCLSIYI